MASARSAWGIDLGNRALKAIKLVSDGGKLVVEDFALIEHEQILSNAGDNRESLMQSVLAAFAERHDLRKSTVAVSVSGQSSFARFIKLPPVEPKKIPEIVRFEAIQQIPFPLDDVEWSYQLFQEAESPDVEVGIFAMRKELVEKQVGFFTSLGLNVQVVQMSPLAVYNAMYHDDRVKGATMFMDSGAENTDLIIADGESVWLRTLPIGGNNFTEVLAKTFKLSFAKAEELKRNAATSKYARQVFQAMRPVFADLVAEIQRSIGFYTAGHREARIRKIIALGSTFRLPALPKYLQQNLQLDVERIDSFAAGAPADTKDATNFSENLVSLTTAYGLAIQAMGQAKINSSLLPESIRRAKMWQEKTKWFGAAAALFVVGALAAGARYYLDSSAYAGNADKRAEANRAVTAATMANSAWQAALRDGETERETLKRYYDMTSCRDVWRNVVHDIYSALPGEIANKPYKEIKAATRSTRKMMVITSMYSKYTTDFGSFAEPGAGPDILAGQAPVEGAPMGFDRNTVFGVQSGGTFNPAAGAARSAATDWSMQALSQSVDENGQIIGGGVGTRRGFIVTVYGYTPSSAAGGAGPALVREEFIRNLKKIQDENHSKDYSIARVVVKYTQPRRSSNVAGQAGEMANPENAAIDRTFQNERTSDDTEFCVVIAVEIAPERPAADATASAGTVP